MPEGRSLLDIALTPSGHLVLFEAAKTGGAELEATLVTKTVGDSLCDAVEKGPNEFLLRLATLQDKAALPPVFAFWRGLGERYLTELCHIPEPAEDLKQPLLAPFDELAEMAVTAPPMRGGEYMRSETLVGIWEELDRAVRSEIASQAGGLGEWLRQRSPL